VSEKLNVTCQVDSYPTVDPIWTHETEPIPANYLKFERQPSMVYSHFTILRLRRENNGTYKCCLQNDPSVCQNLEVIVQGIKIFSQEIQNEKFIIMIVNLIDTPSIPIILNATYFTQDEKFNLKWHINDLGDADINEVFLEWTDTKNNSKNLSIKIVFFCKDDLNFQFDLTLFFLKAVRGDFKGTSSFETFIQNTSLVNSIVRLRVKNIVGYSKTSEPFPIMVVRYIPPANIPSGVISLVICVVFLMIIAIVMLFRR
jgi:hypothetical protein